MFQITAQPSNFYFLNMETVYKNIFDGLDIRLLAEIVLSPFLFSIRDENLSSRNMKNIYGKYRHDKGKKTLQLKNRNSINIKYTQLKYNIRIILGIGRRC